MKCPVCSHVYPDTLSRCSRCGRVAPEAAPAPESKSSLIEFPQSKARPSLPDWRVELNEKVRAIKARRTMEALVDEATSLRQAAIAPPTPVIMPAPVAVPEPEQESSNPIVAAALDRVRRASENAARMTRTTGSLGAAATAAAPAYEQPSHAPIRETPALVVPIASALAAPARVSRPTVASPKPAPRTELFDPAELLDGIDEDLTLLELGNANQLALGPAPDLTKRASIASRGVAALVDVALFCVVSVPFVATTYAIDGDFSRPAVVLLLASTLVLLGVFYLFTMFAIGGRTVGMMLSRTRVVDLEGNAPSPRSVFLRIVGSILAIVPAGLGFAWILFDRERRGWHDLLSGTRVIED